MDTVFFGQHISSTRSHHDSAATMAGALCFDLLIFRCQQYDLAVLTMILVSSSSTRAMVPQSTPALPVSMNEASALVSLHSTADEAPMSSLKSC